MNLRSLRRFLAIVELGSLNKAAVHLAVSQPSLTKDIQDLEQQLGVALFMRTAKGMTLTPSGEAILLRAKLVDTELRKLEGDAVALRDGSMGEINIGVVPGFLQNQVLPTATLNLARRAQGLAVNYQFGHRSNLMPQLLRGDLDFAIVGIEHDEFEHDLNSEPLVRDRNALVVRAGHPILQAEGPLELELLKYPWLVLSECAHWEKMLRQRLGGQGTSAGTPQSRNVIRTDSFYFFRTTLIASECIGLTRFDAARLERGTGSVIELPLGGAAKDLLPGEHMIGIVYRRETALSTASQALIKEIRSLTEAALRKEAEDLGQRVGQRGDVLFP
ncbi:LysR substrate-binding domain-containing protein [soil metagenome]